VAASGTTNWTYGLPTLVDGTYTLVATATDATGESATSPVVTWFKTTIPPNAFSSGGATAGSRLVYLTFSKPLLSSIAKERRRYTVTVGGTPITISSIAYQSTPRRVVLTLARKLVLGESVTVAWKGLRDSQKKLIADGSWSGTAG
jgi:uncharacterized repeat protein (TIGR02059 family)